MATLTVDQLEEACAAAVHAVDVLLSIELLNGDDQKTLRLEGGLADAAAALSRHRDACPEALLWEIEQHVQPRAYWGKQSFSLHREVGVRLAGYVSILEWATRVQDTKEGRAVSAMTLGHATGTLRRSHKIEDLWFDLESEMRAARRATEQDRGTPCEADEIISGDVACERFDTSKDRIGRAVRSGDLTDCRPHGHAPNAPYRLSVAELERRYPQRRQ